MAKGLREGDLIHNRYSVVRSLGIGGMGEVFLAKDTQRNSLVAIKTMRGRMASVPGGQERFQNEIAASFKVIHDNVARAIEHLNDLSILALVVEYVDGGNLALRMERGPLSIDEVLAVITQIASGLEAIHKAGIVHRDLKPENILLTKSGDVKISDFGVAGLGGDSTLTKAGNLVGSAKYIPPEFIEIGECDSRGDIYAWGVIAYELVTGKSPFRSTDIRGLMMERFQTPVGEDLEFLAADSPIALRHIITKAMSVSVAKRYQSVTELLRDLEALYSEAHRRPGAAPVVASSIANPLEKVKKDTDGADRGGIGYLFVTISVIAILVVMYQQLGF